MYLKHIVGVGGTRTPPQGKETYLSKVLHSVYLKLDNLKTLAGE